METYKKALLVILVSLAPSLLMFSASATAERYAAASTGIRAVFHYLTGTTTVDATAAIKMPSYLLTGSTLEAEYFYARGACVNTGSASVHVVLYIGNEKIELGSFSVPFRCGTPAQGQGKLRIVVPSIPVNGLVKGKVCLEAGAIAAYSGITTNIKQFNNVCGIIYITNKEPMFKVKVTIPDGYLGLHVGEHKLVELHIETSVPAEVIGINVEGNKHSSVTFMGSIPLMLKPGTDNALSFDVAGTSSGVDIVTIIIRYKSYGEGVLSAYIPVIVIGNDLQQRITELKTYETQIEQLRSRILSEIRDLVGSAQSVTNLETLLQALTNKYKALEAEYSEIASKEQVMSQEIAALKQRVAILEKRLNELEIKIKQLSDKVNQLATATPATSVTQKATKTGRETRSVGMSSNSIAEVTSAKPSTGANSEVLKLLVLGATAILIGYILAHVARRS